MQKQINKLSVLRSGLVNYIGAILKLTGQELYSHQGVIAILIEESLKLSQKEDEKYDMFLAKPIFRAAIFVLKQRCAELKTIEATNNSAVDHYKDVIADLENIINKFEVS